MEKNRIFESDDYKTYLLARIETLPKGGRGQLQNLAKALSVHPTLVSQVLRGPKHFTSEQTLLVGDFFGLNEMESDYLLALVELERAGNQSLRKYWNRKLEQLKDFHRQVASRGQEVTVMTDEHKIEFYSSWEYSAIRIATAIESLENPNQISERLGIPVKRVNAILDFLLSIGLCVEKNGRVTYGPTRTHVPPDSPIVVNHHTNWRLKALQSHRYIQRHEIAYTHLLAINRNDREEVRKLLVDCMEKVGQLVRQSGSEELCCLNLDWFDVRKDS